MTGLILGLDLATVQAGVVLLELDGDREIYERDMVKATGSWSISRRVKFIADALVEWITEPRIVDIWVEAIATHRVTSAMAMGRIHQATAERIAAHSSLDRRVDVAFGELTPQAVKQHAVGRGNADKPAMIKAAIERWPGLHEANEDEADAAWIADLGAIKFLEVMTPTQGAT